MPETLPRPPETVFDYLVRTSRFPADVRTLALAGVLSQALARAQRPLVRGLPEASFQRLMKACFPGVFLANTGAPSPAKSALHAPDPAAALATAYAVPPSPAHAAPSGPGPAPGAGAAPDDEFDDLLALLLEHRARDDDLHTWLSYGVASASMGERHLWQDMGLPNRALLTRLLRENFPTLAAQNAGDMKWKKFFYRQLCQRAGLNLCRSPHCADCGDFSLCFGPETAAGVVPPLAR